MSSRYQICQHCVMDTSDPDIRFDAEGVCSHCHRHRLLRPQTHGLESMRVQLVQEIKENGRGRPFDCLIGLSGGVDSSYLALKAVEWGLRPLAVHLDNGWNSEIAVQNISSLVDKLSLEYRTCVLDWHEFREIQKAYFRSGVPNVEAPTDHAILAFLHRAARKHSIKLILSGSNFATESVLPEAWAYPSVDAKIIKQIVRQFGAIKIKSLPMLSLPRYFFDIYVRRIRKIRILNFIEYDRASAIEELSQKVGWSNYGGKHHESVFTKFFQAVYLPGRYGFDKRRGHYSSEILNGRLSRDEALRLLEQPPVSSEEAAELTRFVLSKLEWSTDDWTQVLAGPIRREVDLPNNRQLFAGLRSIQSALGKGVRSKPASVKG